MSWCRWSTVLPNGRSSQLYIYDSVGDFVAVLVAGRRRIGEENAPKSPPLTKDNVKEYLAAHKERQKWYDEFEANGGQWENLPEKWAGKSFEYTDMDELIALLKVMREDGIEFPDYVFEIAEESKEEYK